MTPEQKKTIDEMSYTQMLSLWRFAPVGHPMFEGDTGEYFSKVMKEKKEKVGAAGHTAASKLIGWG